MISADAKTSASLVVDVHALLGPTARPGDSGPRFDRLVQAMDLAGVDCACVFASTGRGSDYPLENDLIAELAGEAGGRIIPFARFDPHWRDEAAQGLRALAANGIRGLKLHPFMDGAFMANDRELVHPLMNVAFEYGLVVLIHSGWGWNSAPGVIADLARSFPDVTVVMGHSGRYGYHREAAVVGSDYGNLMFDVAGLSIPGAIEELVRIVGAERVLFGSDHPYSPMGFEIEKLARWTTLPWKDIEMIAGRNAARLLGIEGPSDSPIVEIRRSTDEPNEEPDQ